MNFFYSYETDRGNEKTENQDSILLKRAGDGQNHYCIAAFTVSYRPSLHPNWLPFS